jgi:hypothetical protein
MFALHMVNGSRPDLFEPNEWDFFLGNIAIHESKSNIPSWLPQDRHE